MMKKLLFLALILLVTRLFSQAVITVGAGNNLTIVPINPYNDYTVSQMLYDGGILATAGLLPGDITKLEFQVYGAIPSTDPYTWRNWEIRMKHTNLTAQDFTAWEDPMTMQQVFNGDTYINGQPQILATDEWYVLNLQSPFTYTGGSLLIQVRGTSAGVNYEFPYWKGESVADFPTRTWSRNDEPITNENFSSWPQGNNNNLNSRPNIRITTAPPNTDNDPPFPATLVSPENGATSVPLNTTLQWVASTSGNPATAFTVLFGSANPPITIVANSQTSSTFTPQLANGNTYYWRVIPENNNGPTSETDCPIWSFSTMPAVFPIDLAITSITGPAFIPSSTPIIVTVSNAGTSTVLAQSYSIDIHKVTGQSATLLYTIPSAQTVEMLSGDTTHPYEIQPSVYNNWTTWGESGSATIRATVVLANDGNLDNNFSSYQTTIRTAYDIALLSVTGATVIPTTTSMVITLENQGFGEILSSHYTLNIKMDNETLGTATPVAITAGSSNQIEIPASTVNAWNYGAVSGLFHFTVELSTAEVGDHPENNTTSLRSFRLLDVSTIVEVGIGADRADFRIPFDMYYKESLVQSLYRNAEFGAVSTGYITHIYYKLTIANTDNTEIAFPVSIYMSNYNELIYGFADNTDWVAGSEFTPVLLDYDLLTGIREVGFLAPLGAYDIWIPLDEPFLYTGGDLVVMTYKDHTYTTSSDNVFAQTNFAQQNMSIFKHIDGAGGTFNPEDPAQGTGSANNALVFRPQMRFAFTLEPDNDNDISIPCVISGLIGNYPNPFNPTTTIAFDMARSGHVDVEVYNIRGQKVRVLVSDVRGAGRHSVVWNGDDATGRSVGSGVYFYRMTTAGYSSVKKMLMMK